MSGKLELFKSIVRGVAAEDFAGRGMIVVRVVLHAAAGGTGRLGDTSPGASAQLETT